MRRSLEALLLVLVFDNLAVAGGLSLLEASTETKKFLWCGLADATPPCLRSSLLEPKPVLSRNVCGAAAQGSELQRPAHDVLRRPAIRYRLGFP